MLEVLDCLNDRKQLPVCSAILTLGFGHGFAEVRNNSLGSILDLGELSTSPGTAGIDV